MNNYDDMWQYLIARNHPTLYEAYLNRKAANYMSDTPTGTFLVMTVENPASVHVFGTKVVVVTKDGTVYEIKRESV